MIAEDSSLDEWFFHINKLYYSKNAGPASIFSIALHFSPETTGELAAILQGRRDITMSIDRYLAKAFAWYISLAGALHVPSLEDVVWNRYPGVCPYCLSNPHKADCKSDPDQPIDWPKVYEFAKPEAVNGRARPTRLSEWVHMFWEIYGDADPVGWLTVSPPGFVWEDGRSDPRGEVDEREEAEAFLDA